MLAPLTRSIATLSTFARLRTALFTLAFGCLLLHYTGLFVLGDDTLDFVRGFTVAAVIMSLIFRRPWGEKRA